MTDAMFPRRQLRGLMRDVAWTRRLAAQHAAERETVIRQHGAAHPRSIEATRQLHRSAGAHRRLLRLYRMAASQDDRTRRHERVHDRWLQADYLAGTSHPAPHHNTDVSLNGDQERRVDTQDDHH